MAQRSTAIVRQTLLEYADRGVLRSFSEERGRRGATEFSFLWLVERPFHLVCGGNGTLSFRDLLPGVPARSRLDRELRGFLRERVDGALPRHRKVDPKRAEVRLVNRKGNVSLALTVKNNQYRYGVRKLLNLVHELFVHLHDSHVEYMWEHFNLPQE